MEDWTDIIGEELRDVEEPLPADDWGVLQQKYAAARRKKRAVAFAWSGAVASVAAVLAVFVLAFREVPSSDSMVNPSVSPDNQYVAEVVDTVGVRPQVTAPSVVSPTVPGPVPGPVSAPVSGPSSATVPDGDEVSDREDDIMEETFHVVADTTAVTERLIADAGDSAGKDEQDDAYDDAGLRFEDLPVEDVTRRRVRMSLGLSGSVSGSPMVFAMMDAVPGTDLENPEPPDSSEVSVPSEAVKARAKRAYDDRYSHHIPVSFGVSARFHLNKRLSINAGLDYTRYNSVRTRTFAGGHVQTDDQQVHYIGIPVRADWMFVNRKYFSMYLGAGAQMDKCVYAKVGGERLHENKFLFGVTGALGMQVNFTPMVGLYFEPDVTYSLNEPELETFRSKHRTMISARAGLRFTF